MTERPLSETLYCTSMRCDSSRCMREAGLRKPSQKRTREKCLYAHLRTYTQPTQLFATGASFQSTPSPVCGRPDGPCLAPCSMYLGSNSWLDFTADLPSWPLLGACSSIPESNS